VAVRDRNGEPSADGCTLPRSELDALARRQVEAGVARVRARGHDRVVTQALDGELDHAPLIR
jgi:hypothetical protein